MILLGVSVTLFENNRQLRCAKTDSKSAFIPIVNETLMYFDLEILGLFRDIYLKVMQILENVVKDISDVVEEVRPIGFINFRLGCIFCLSQACR